MASPEQIEILMGEDAGKTHVGIQPPIPEDQIEQIISGIPERERPDRVVPENPGNRGTHTLLEFPHPHFGKYRNIYALNALEALKSALSNNGTRVWAREKIIELHGDHQLFE